MTLTRHIRRYAISGLLQWALEYALVLVLSQWLLPIAAANVIGRVCGALFGFWLNGRWTFAGQRHGLSRRAGLRFVLVWIVMTALNTAWVGLIAHHTALRTAQLLKPVGDIITAGLGFLLSRHWVYRR
ncbi:MAG: GtrA family protein [Thermomonas sp.]|uniref:GtrA family protein n=1 Tax=Thermomonas sp. TaxID=1971895 RepID=UPI00262EA4B3|nr:GtrA family protein [Thermomonas sp.]MCC7097718.1 GtrA family protein [Thermomonas sp.]